MKYNKQFLSILVLGAIILPQTILAASTTKPVREPKEPKVVQNKFCENIDNRLSNSSRQLSERESELQTRTEKREAEMNARRGDKDTKVEDRRAEALTRQEKKFNSVLSKATTTEQKLVLQEFRAGVQAAVEVRQKAMDDARDEFRKGVDETVTDRQGQMDNALTVRQTAIDSASAKAKSDCASGVESQTVRNTFQASIKSAQETFKASISGLKDGKDDIKSLTETRQVAFEKAQTDFRNTLESLKKTLQEKLN